MIIPNQGMQEGSPHKLISEMSLEGESMDSCIRKGNGAGWKCSRLLLNVRLNKGRALKAPFSLVSDALKDFLHCRYCHLKSKNSAK